MSAGVDEHEGKGQLTSQPPWSRLWGVVGFVETGERSPSQRRKHCFHQLISPGQCGSDRQSSDFPREATHLHFSGEFPHLSVASGNVCVCMFVHNSQFLPFLTCSPSLRMISLSSKLKAHLVCEGFFIESWPPLNNSSSFHMYCALCL